MEDDSLEDEEGNSVLNDSTRSDGPPTTSRRAKSVPAYMLGNRTARTNEVRYQAATCT